MTETSVVTTSPNFADLYLVSRLSHVSTMEMCLLTGAPKGLSNVVAKSRTGCQSVDKKVVIGHWGPQLPVNIETPS
jgi:hypothetical protein